MAGDILIFENDILKGESIDKYYTDVRPKIAIEVDITADTTEIGGVHTCIKIKKIT